MVSISAARRSEKLSSNLDPVSESERLESDVPSPATRLSQTSSGLAPEEATYAVRADSARFLSIASGVGIVIKPRWISGTPPFRGMSLYPA